AAARASARIVVGRVGRTVAARRAQSTAATAATAAGGAIRSSNAIRSSFLEFFQFHGHTRVPASSLVPVNDSTLLFTNAGGYSRIHCAVFTVAWASVGMVQFKDMFTGAEAVPAAWKGGACSAQK